MNYDSIAPMHKAPTDIIDKLKETPKAEGEDIPPKIHRRTSPRKNPTLIFLRS